MNAQMNALIVFRMMRWIIQKKSLHAEHGYLKNDHKNKARVERC